MKKLHCDGCDAELAYKNTFRRVRDEQTGLRFRIDIRIPVGPDRQGPNWEDADLCPACEARIIGLPPVP